MVDIHIYNSPRHRCFDKQFFFICFTIGGLAAYLVNFLGLPPISQSIMFCIVSIASLIFIIPYVKRVHKRDMGQTAPLEDKYIGKTIVLDQDMSHNTIMMQVNGIYWTLKGTGEPMAKGDRVVIIGVEAISF